MYKLTPCHIDMHNYNEALTNINRAFKMFKNCHLILGRLLCITNDLTTGVGLGDSFKWVHIFFINIWNFGIRLGYT